MVKSAAKIRRNVARAEARGETYTPPEPAPKAADENAEGEKSSSGESEEVIQKKAAAAQKLQEALATVETNPENLNAKEKRSAKKKAEAIAAEESGCTLDELTEWYKQHKASIAGKKKKGKARNNNNPAAAIEKLSEEEKAKLETAKKLDASLTKLEKDDSLNAKERRSAKRKAEAIASEEAGGTPSEELLEWYKTIVPPSKDSDGKGKKIPYIIFVGQLAYSTTSDMLYDHFLSTLGKDVITKESIKIRLLTDTKTKKSRGMAFVELETPEIMYECLKLHLTHVDGRRINVERSAGGGAAAKKARITTFRESQSKYISETMSQIILSFTKNGEIEPEELDEGVLSLCNRHSATVVEAALKEYVQEKKERKAKKEELGEKEEEEFRNPSAFLTHMLGRIAEEGVGNSSKGKTKRDGDGGGGRGRGGGPGRGGGAGRGSGGRGRGGGDSTRSGFGSSSSMFQKSGVDMSNSSRGSSYGSGGRGSNMAEIFPSMGRGRGRGRGYM